MNADDRWSLSGKGVELGLMVPQPRAGVRQIIWLGEKLLHSFRTRFNASATGMTCAPDAAAARTTDSKNAGVQPYRVWFIAMS